MEDDGWMRTPLLRERSSGSSFTKACLNAANVFLGIGLLTVPYAVSSGGWLSLALFILVATITFYAGVFLTRCMDTDPSIKNYLDIAERAFGRPGRIAVLIITNMELYLYCISFLIMEGDNLHKLFPEFTICVDGKRSFVIITGLVILPTMLLTDLGCLSYVLATGVVSCLVILGSLICVALFDGVGFTKRGSLLNLSGIPTSVSLYTVFFAGVAVVPSIYTSMKSPQKFNKVLLFSLLITSLIYLSMAILGYLMYGENVESQITLNLSTSSVAGNIAIYTTLLVPITKYALVMTPVAKAIEVGLADNKKNNIVVKRAIRLGLLFSSMIFAFVFPYYESLSSLTGSLFAVVVSFLLPCFCYLKISGCYRVWSFKLLGIVFILVFGIVAGVLGTYTSIVELAQET